MQHLEAIIERNRKATRDAPKHRRHHVAAAEAWDNRAAFARLKSRRISDACYEIADEHVRRSGIAR